MVRVNPSSMARTVKCPGSARQKSHIPYVDHGAEGRASHWYAEKLIKGVIPTETQYEGTPITAEIIECAEMYANYVLSVVENPNLLNIEIKRHFKYIGCNGTVDADYMSNKVVDIFDYKFGWITAEAYENWQCLTYATNYLECDIHTVNIHIIQPRPYHPAGKIRTWSLSKDQLKMYTTKIKHAVINARSENPRYNPGNHCLYCNGTTTCLALLEASYDAIMHPTGNVELTDVQKAYELDVLQRKMVLMRARITSIEAEIEHGLRNGKAYNGWSLITGRGSTRWNRSDEDVYKLGELSNVDLRKISLVTPTQAKSLGVHEKLVDAYSIKKPGALKLTKIDGQKIFGGK